MAPTDKKFKLWTPTKDNMRAKRALVVAAYAGIELEIPQMTMGESNKTPEFLKKNPIGRVPVLETPCGKALFESIAIIRFLATLDKKNNLLGRNDWETAQVDQWLAFTGTTLEPASNAWLSPIIYPQFVSFDEGRHKWAVEETKRVFEALNRWLETRTYLVAERLSLADLAVVATLVPMYKAVIDPRFRGPFVNLNRYFETITQQETFRSVISIDPNAWCTVAQKAPAPKKAEAKKEEAKKEEKKEEKKPEAKKAAKKDDDEEEEDDTPKEVKPKNPLDLLPKSPFALDEFKREFSNKPLDEALEFFYKNFDAAGYTLWYSKYKYNDELTKTWLSGNLINGMFQRMESMRKYAFGVQSVFGVDDANEISGFWVFRGTGNTLPETQLAVDDTSLYEWTQIDFANIEGEKARIKAYLKGDDIDGKPYADGKTFK